MQQVTSTQIPMAARWEDWISAGRPVLAPTAAAMLP